jgi:TolB-like protein
LKVDAVLSGSLQQLGECVRVTTQLLRVSDGATLWGAQFDAKSTDVFAVEDALSIQLVGALTKQLIGQEEEIGARLNPY